MAGLYQKSPTSSQRSSIEQRQLNSPSGRFLLAFSGCGGCPGLAAGSLGFTSKGFRSGGGAIGFRTSGGGIGFRSSGGGIGFRSGGGGTGFWSFAAPSAFSLSMRRRSSCKFFRAGSAGRLLDASSRMQSLMSSSNLRGTENHKV